MKVAAIQMVSGVAVVANLASAQAWVERAAAQGAELIALPEYFCALGMQDQDKLAYAEDWGAGPIQDTLAQWAQACNVWLVGGSLPLRIKGSERVTNSSLLFSPEGQCQARYDKVHLFRFTAGHEHYDESVRVAPGTGVVNVPVALHGGHICRLGMSVCYDLRFPELFRMQSRAGMDLLVVPSAFTHTTGQAHWELLLRARAVENQCYVLAPAQGGLHENGRRTWGHSMLIDPWGQVITEVGTDGEGMAIGTVDFGYLQQVRQQLPALEHRVW